MPNHVQPVSTLFSLSGCRDIRGKPDYLFLGGPFDLGQESGRYHRLRISDALTLQIM